MHMYDYPRSRSLAAACSTDCPIQIVVLTSFGICRLN